ncbi:hypothetical protein LEL_08203 [Akanthomyces lecanii RCEF 1005]|uniref:Uncharacterized protein n=1 Tax=Akanthomyces lecanii RCEF 1005 TaxID=1081108 RepID=A0A162JWD9_CORDF|nr:hypothetical protein LEL_08203 [Akanthomyces lecanii RCEF 1005]
MDETKSNVEPALTAYNYKPKSKRMAREWKRQMKPSTAKGSHSDHHQRTTPPMLTEGETAVAIAKQVNGGGGGGTSYRSKKYKPMVVMAARPGIVVANGSGWPRWPSGGPTTGTLRRMASSSPTAPGGRLTYGWGCWAGARRRSSSSR